MLFYLVTVLITFIDVSWEPLLNFRGAAPQFLLVWIFSAALFWPNKSFKAAFIAGLLKDLLTGMLLGTNAIALLAAAAAVFLSRGRFFRQKLLTSILLLCALTFLYPTLSSWTLVFPTRVMFGVFVFNAVIFFVCSWLFSRWRPQATDLIVAG